ncbi:MAG: hypothetical protein HYX22_01015 [Candidatus Yanofskybacteria bacterium]|nr:hypothetical protein [Candidatus Yanofskybacteria bacterium]
MRLSQKWVDKLVNLPESGMGYQTVDVILKNGSTVRGLIVINCQDILGKVYFSEDDIVDIVASDI